jgi:cell wall-associated NlpC family hydrolase
MMFAMRKIGLILLVAVWSAQAEPQRPADDIERFLAERGLLSQVDQLRQRVSQKASDLVVNAMGFLGVPYRRGGNNAETGFDCSGFVRAMFEQSVGLVLPRRASEQAAATEVIDRQDLQPGDLVFYNTMRQKFSHVGIYVGDGKFIHSPKPGQRVRVEDMRQAYWERRFSGARRVPVEPQPKPGSPLTLTSPADVPVSGR